MLKLLSLLLFCMYCCKCNFQSDQETTFSYHYRFFCADKFFTIYHRFFCPIRGCTSHAKSKSLVVRHLQRSHFSRLIRKATSRNPITLPLLGMAQESNGSSDDNSNARPMDDEVFPMSANSNLEVGFDSYGSILSEDRPSQPKQATDTPVTVCKEHKRIETAVDLKERLKSDIAHKIICFFINSRDYYSLSHSAAKSLTHELHDIVSSFSYSTTLIVQQILKEKNVDDKFHDIKNGLNFDAFFDSCLHIIISDRQLLHYIKQNFSYVEPMAVHFSPNTSAMYYVPMGKTLTTLLQNPDFYQLILDTKLKDKGPFFRSPYFEKYISSLLGTNTNEDPDYSKAIYISLYTDEFEVCNPIGKAKTKHKILAIYYKILNISPEFQSKQDFTFLACLVKWKSIFNKASNPVGMTLNDIYAPLVTELNYLYDFGIEVSNGNGSKKQRIPVIACFCVGDNLSINSLVGIGTNFTSGHACRFCTAKANDPNFCLKQDSFLQRDEAWLISETIDDGINDNCPLLELGYVTMPFFFPPDLFHDLLEGVSHTVVCIVFNFLIKSKVMSLNEIKDVLKRFPLSLPSIAVQHLRRGRLPFCAADMIIVVFRMLLYFGPFIRNARHESQQDIMRLLFLHCELLSLLLANNPVAETYNKESIRLLVSEHNMLIYSLSNEKPKTKCKLHYLLHYPDLMHLFNGLKIAWSMRYESTHQIFKRIARMTRNFKNIAFTCATRYQTRIATILPSLPSSSNCKALSISMWEIKENIGLDVMQLIADFLCTDLNGIPPICQQAGTLQIKGFIYHAPTLSQRQVLINDIKEEDPTEPSLVMIWKILFIHNKWLLVTRQLDSFFLPTYFAYYCKPSGKICIVEPALHFFHPPVTVDILNGTEYVILPYFSSL